MRQYSHEFAMMLVVCSFITAGCAAGRQGTGSTEGAGGAGGDGGNTSVGGAGGSGGEGGGMQLPKRIFMTKTMYNGNLAAAGNAASGIEGGDNLCNLAASAAVLGGTWQAWLSDANVDAIARLADVGPWYQVDRSEVIFNNKANILTGPLVPVIYNENGESVEIEDGVWTGTMNNGKKDPLYPTDCNNWVNGTNTGTGWIGLGKSSDANDWTEYYEKPCQSLYHLYCFEQ